MKRTVLGRDLLIPPFPGHLLNILVAGVDPAIQGPSTLNRPLRTFSITNGFILDKNSSLEMDTSPGQGAEEVGDLGPDPTASAKKEDGTVSARRTPRPRRGLPTMILREVSMRIKALTCRIKRSFQQFWKQPPKLAEPILERWYYWATHSQLEPVLKSAKTIKEYWEGLLPGSKPRWTAAPSRG